MGTDTIIGVLELQDLLRRHFWFVCFQILTFDVALNVEITKAITSRSSLKDSQLMGHIANRGF